MNEPSTDVAVPSLKQEALAALRVKIRRMIEERRRSRSRTPAVPPPRYDEVFVAGTEWLDRMAREDRWTD